MNLSCILSQILLMDDENSDVHWNSMDSSRTKHVMQSTTLRSNIEISKDKKRATVFLD